MQEAGTDEKPSQKGGILRHLNLLINMDKTVTQLVKILTAFQNRYNSYAVITVNDNGGFGGFKKQLMATVVM